MMLLWRISNVLSLGSVSTVIQDNLEDKNGECEAALTSINNAGQEGTWDIPK